MRISRTLEHLSIFVYCNLLLFTSGLTLVILVCCNFLQRNTKTAKWLAFENFFGYRNCFYNFPLKFELISKNTCLSPIPNIKRRRRIWKVNFGFYLFKLNIHLELVCAIVIFEVNIPIWYLGDFSRQLRTQARNDNAVRACC